MTLDTVNHMTPQSPFSWRFAAISLMLLSIPAVTSAGAVDAPGVPNFSKVNDQVYRGAQPSDDGFQSLSKLGIRTVIDLRMADEHSTADEQRVVEAAGMRYVSLPMEGMAKPSNEQVSRVMAILEDSAAGPVFLHCKRGADRTGALIACYRIRHEGWQNKKALHEAKSFGMSWFQLALQHYVLAYRAAPPSAPLAVAVAAP